MKNYHNPPNNKSKVNESNDSVLPCLKEVQFLTQLLENSWGKVMSELDNSGQLLNMSNGRGHSSISMSQLLQPNLPSRIRRIYRNGVLNHLANHIHGRANPSGGSGGNTSALSGRTVQIVWYTQNGLDQLLAGINSSSGGFTVDQMNLLHYLGIHAAPLTMKNMGTHLPHAEENMGVYLQNLMQQSNRIKTVCWTAAVVGRGTGWNCRTCKSLMQLFGPVTIDERN